jgi:glycosyltransferase involved in cell wall biosynthesis
VANFNQRYKKNYKLYLVGNFDIKDKTPNNYRFSLSFQAKSRKLKKERDFSTTPDVTSGFARNDNISQNFLLKKGEMKKDLNQDIDLSIIKIFSNPSREKLKKLYQQATALLTASFYESFNFPVLEGLSCGCPVVGLKPAIIPEMKQFVHLADDEEDFLSHMKNITMGKIKKIDQKKLSQIFSWKKYVEQLKSLY